MVTYVNLAGVCSYPKHVSMLQRPDQTRVTLTSMPTTVDRVFGLSVAVLLLIGHLILYPWLIVLSIPNNWTNSLQYLAIGYFDSLLSTLPNSAWPCVFEKSFDASCRLARPSGIDWYLL